jgi:hypothetical protein
MTWSGSEPCPDTLRLISEIRTLENIDGGICLGFLVSLLTLSINRALLGNGLRPAMNAWGHPMQLLLVCVLSMGWLYGAAVAFVAHSRATRSYQRPAYLLLACGCIRGVDLTFKFLVRR